MFCGCNKRIKINYGIEIQYQKSIVKEWELDWELLE